MHRRHGFVLLLFVPALLVVAGCANLRLPAIDPSGRSIFLPNPNFTTIAQDGPLGRILHRGRQTTPGGAIRLPGPYQPAFLNRHRGSLARLLRHDGLQSGVLGNLHARKRQFDARLLNHLRLFHNRHRGTGLRNAPLNAPILGNSAQFNAPVFSQAPEPPPCGPDGRGPANSPCYPIGSPTQSSLAQTLPGSGNRIFGPANPNSFRSSGCQSNPASVAIPTSNCSFNSQLSTQQLAIPRFGQLGPGVVLATPRMTARVGQEMVVVGGIQSTSGVTRPGEPVRWSLSNDSVGTIIDAARPVVVNSRPRLLGFLHRPPAATSSGPGCGNCVESVTSARCALLTRNPVDPADDVYLSRGQSWVSLTSGSEGRSYVTLLAPQLEGRRQATAIVDWIDAAWDCPAPVISSLEGPGRLVTKVCRSSDQRPLPNWIVRYSILDGPRARLGASDDDQRLETYTDANGNASIDVFPVGVGTGVTRVGIEIVDPRRPELPVGKCVGFVTWSESAIAGQLPTEPTQPRDLPPAFPPARPAETPADRADIPIDGPFTPAPQDPFPPRQQPPRQAPREPLPQQDLAALTIAPNGPNGARVNEPFDYRVMVTNNSNTTARNVVVTTLPQRGLTILDSQPVRPVRSGNQVDWRLGSIEPGQSKAIQVVAQADRPDRYRQAFFASADNATRRDNYLETIVAGDPIALRVSSPDPPRVGEVVRYGVEVQNRTDVPRRVTVAVRNWSRGLEPIVPVPPESPQKGITQSFEILGNASEPLPLEFRVREPGPQEFDVVVVDEQTGFRLDDRPVVSVVGAPPQPQGVPNAEIEITSDRPRVVAGGTDRLSVTVRNTGEVPLNNVRIRVTPDEDLLFEQATGGYTPGADNSLTWSIPRLERNQNVKLEIEGRVSPNPARSQTQLLVELESDEGSKNAVGTIDIDEGFGSSGPRTSQKPIVGARNSLLAQAEVRPAKVRVGQPIEFLITVANDNGRSFRDLEISLEVAKGMRFDGFDGPVASARTLSEGRLLVFSPVPEIRPGQRLTFRGRVIAERAGVAKMLGSVHATGLPNPLIVSDSTNVSE